jgi:hypothetical protein
LLILKDLPVHAAFASDPSTARTEPLKDTDIEHCMSYAGVSETLPDPDEAHSIFNELLEAPEPTEYDDADLTYNTLHDSSSAAVAVSDDPTASMSTSTSQPVKAHEEDAASSGPTIAVMTKEAENGRQPNIDMDRFSSLSLTSSTSSGFASLRSLAQRIRLRQREESTALDDPPSNVMDWDRSNNSLQLFERFSFSSSIASSQVTNGSGMSYTMLSSEGQYSCVACNVCFSSKSSLSRHWTQYCECEREWICLLCVSPKGFRRKDKLFQHHMQDHDLPCEKDKAWSISYLPPKKAWGCPCCLRCFDTFAAWTKHCVNHPLQNGKVIGWSLNTMVQSLILQPYLTDAIAYLPLPMFDLANVQVDICRILREALERHKLPDAVRDHYDYRYLQLPEALAKYVFRLVAYRVPYDVSYLGTSLITGESAADPIAE